MSSGFGIRPRPGIFWGEMAAHEHIAQFYESDDTLLESLTGFVVSGLNRDESVILIATPDHLRSLNRILIEAGVDIDTAAAEDRYITLDARMGLASFMVKGWPDAQRFHEFASLLLRRAGSDFRHVRIFGEMVGVLWARGQSTPTVQLEQLWQQLCSANPISLFCAYPRDVLTRMQAESLAGICLAHTHILSATVVFS